MSLVLLLFLREEGQSAVDLPYANCAKCATASHVHGVGFSCVSSAIIVSNDNASDLSSPG